MNRVDQLWRERPDAIGFAQGYLAYLTEVLARIDVTAIAVFTEQLLAARDRGARIFFIGNGGSAATASHFANDLAVTTRSWKRPFRAMSLTDNAAVVTAIGNDYGFEEIFVNQLQTQLVAGDVVVAISASGRSPNVVRAVEYANLQEATTIALTGFDGGELRDRVSVHVHVPTNDGEYGPTEDVHIILDHLVSAFLMNVCRSENQG